MTLLAACDAHEGPVVRGDVLWFTSVRRGARVALRGLVLETGAVCTLRPDANAANGMALAADGRLVVCEQGTLATAAAIALIDPETGAREVLLDRVDGRPLNSPNDVIVASDGSVWFTDPSYGHLQGFRPPPHGPDAVYRWDARTGECALVAEGFDKPNGLALSPGERTLYVGDSERRLIEAFDVVDARRLENRRLFARVTPGYPDGLKVDGTGRVHCTFGRGIAVFAPDGRPRGELALPGAVNFAIAGDDVLVTADTGVHRLAALPALQEAIA